MEILNATIFKNKKLNNLGDLLKEKIKSRKDPFYTISIIFPNNKVIEWFRSYWLKTEKDVLMNVKFYSLEEGLFDLLELPNKFTLVKRAELRTLIIKELTRLDKTELDDKIRNYIYKMEGSLDSIRLYDLANSLSKLFVEYELDAIEIKDYQQKIYDNVLSELYQKNKGTFIYIYNNNKAFKKVDEVIFFGFSDLDNLYCNVISELGKHTDVLFYKIDNELDLSVEPILMSAPSKTREIEMIHSEICKLSLSSEVNYSDFLVICPDVSSYELEINKVFNQSSDKGVETFPNIPFSINASKQQNTFDEQAIKKLFEIASKGFYTRLDFTHLINNKVIREARNITDGDIFNWTKSIIEMNVYRNGKNIDDWQYAKKRVVLSKVSNMNDIDKNIVELSCGSFVPYSNIEFDDNSICRFVSLIDDLDKWISEFNKDSLVDRKKLETLIIELEKWFSIKDKYGHESNKIYRKYLEEINTWIYKGVFNDKTPLNTLFYTLFDLSKDNKNSQSNMFTRGVTFVDYEENITLTSKYVFIIGLSSNEFPSKNSRSELDLRKEIKNVNDFKSFVCQCNNATQGLYLSHVNYDLKSDEEFFPSTFIINLYDKLGKKLVDEKTDEIIYDKKIGIDETRPWSELFTKKEYKEKDYYFDLFKTKNEEKQEDVSENPNSENIINEEEAIVKEKNEVDIVTVSQMKNFLLEPLKYKAERLFGYEDDTMDLLKEEYEPFILNNLDNSILVKTVVAYILRNPDNELITSDDEVNLVLAKEIFKRFILEHKIPNINSEVENSSIINVVLNAFKIVKNLKEITFIAPEIQKLEDTKLETSTKKIIFSYNGELCIHSNGISRNYIEVSCSKADEYDLITMYLCSLIDIARENREIDYEVKIYKSNKNATFTVSPKLAKQILISIYWLMNDYNNNIYFPIKLIKETKKYEEVVLDSYDDNGSWAYFKGRKLFSAFNDLGFTRDDFEQKITRTKKIIKSLILYLDKEEE